MKFDLCYVLIDLGNPWYKTAASEMIRSARRAFKDHDMRIVQLSDSKTAPHPDADGIFGLETEVGKEQMCQAKGHLIAEYALQAEVPVVFCDVDLLWNSDGLLAHVGHRVACLFRDNMPSMPINTGVIVSPPSWPFFWEKYRDACANLPTEMCAWWGDQVAMTAVWLEIFRTADFDYHGWPELADLNMDEVAPAIDTLPDKPLTTPAVHFKGNRKELMIPYARMLDGGMAFEFARPYAGEIADAFIQHSKDYNEQVPPRSGWAF